MNLLDRFSTIVLCDTEFRSVEGGLPEVVCLVFREIPSGRTLRLWADELAQLDRPPFDIGPNALFVAYYASAEFGTFLQLGWPLPVHVLDLYAEFRCRTNGLDPVSGNKLIGALVYFGLPGIEAVEKESMRRRILQGGPFTEAERRAILDYCQSDVDALERLLPRLAPGDDLTLEHALLRGRYMRAAARIERHGTPLDAALWERLLDRWPAVRHRLIVRVDADYGVFAADSFNAERLERYLERERIPWPRHPTGALQLDKDTRKERARVYPALWPLHELLSTLAQLRKNRLVVGPDGCNRVMLSAFGTKTGRNATSTSAFIFGPATWMRSLIRPTEDRALAYVDWRGQEIGIAAALSGDCAMIEGYRSGDPHMDFARRVGAVPPGATKATHADVREKHKSVGLGVQYGMGPGGLEHRLGDLAEAYRLLDLHRRVFATFWEWSDAAVAYAWLTGGIHTVFGWRYRTTAKSNDRTLRNWVMQSNGAEMLRLACCLATERGIEVCASIHDALLVEGPADVMDDVVAETRRCMAEASAIVLGGFTLDTDVKVVRFPGRYSDERGVRLWTLVSEILDELG